MLRFAEEILLLLLEDKNGKFVHVPELSMRCVLAGSVLMDLALELKIDTDFDKLVLLDPTPVGDNLLDPTLSRIAEAEKKRVEENEKERDARYWVEMTAREAEEIRGNALERLIQRGILRREDDRILWVFKSRRYPMVDGRAEQEVKLRIMEVLFSDVIPDPRDIVIISLADACGIFKILLSEREYKRARERVQNLRKMDLIGQAVSNSVREIEAVLALALHPPF